MKGMAYAGLQQYKEAMKCFDRALNITPDDFELWYQKGVIFDILKDYKAAIECYDKAISFNPDLIDAWYNKGVRS